MILRFSPTLALALTFLLAGCAGANPLGSNESLDWNLGHFDFVFKEKTGWKGIGGKETWRRVYGKKGETYKNWTVKAEVTDLPIAITLGTKVRWNPESVMNSLKAQKQKKLCSTDMWTVLEKDKTSILYEWQNISCPGYFHQHEIVRIVMGQWYLWIISYGIKDKALSADERTDLIENLLKAKVV